MVRDTPEKLACPVMRSAITLLSCNVNITYRENVVTLVTLVMMDTMAYL